MKIRGTLIQQKIHRFRISKSGIVTLLRRFSSGPVAKRALTSRAMTRRESFERASPRRSTTPPSFPSPAIQLQPYHQACGLLRPRTLPSPSHNLSLSLARPILPTLAICFFHFLTLSVSRNLSHYFYLALALLLTFFILPPVS